MPRREKAVAHSIVDALYRQEDKRSILSRATSKFWLYYLVLERYRNDLFEELRESWDIDNGDYNISFGGEDGKDVALHPMATMGFSGSVCDINYHIRTRSICFTWKAYSDLE